MPPATDMRMKKIKMVEHRPMTSIPVRFYSVTEIAERLGMSEKTIRRWISAGDLVAHRLGQQLRIAENDFQIFLKLRRDL